MGFGQPGWSSFLAPFAAACGYALFWKSFLIFSSVKKRFWAATLWFALVQAIQLSWMTSHEYQGLYILFVYALLTVGLGVQFGMLSLVLPGEGPLSILRVLALASFWTLFEWLRFFILCGFSFNPVGMALSASLLSLQFAAFWGVLGLSFWVILTNGFAFNLFFRPSLSVPDQLLAFPLFPKVSSRAVKALGIWVAVAAFPYLFGIAHLKVHDGRNKNAEKLTVALVQPGLLPSQKIPLAGRLDAFIPPLEQWRRIFFLLSQAHAKRVDLIVLPEAALPFFLDEPLFSLSSATSMVLEELGSEALGAVPALQPPFAIAQSEQIAVTHAFFAKLLAKHFKAEVVAGFDGYDRALQKSYNAAYHFLPYSSRISRYDKRILMPVAEYLPFEWARRLAQRYGICDFFEPGNEAKVFEGRIPFSVSICYEETFPHLVREGRKGGAALLVTLTNDNWYPQSRLPRQHFDLGRLRAVENGAPLLRSGNSGITAAVDSLGRVLAKVGRGGRSDWVSGIIVTEISSSHHNTPYLLWGNWGILIPSVCFLCAALLRRRLTGVYKWFVGR